MLICDAFANWHATIRPAVVEACGADDMPALSESWNNYTDSLCKDGALTSLQYQHCPAFDDAMPVDEDDEIDHILDCLSVFAVIVEISSRPDGLDLDWDKRARHFHVTITRGGDALVVYYSQGSGVSAYPGRADVLGAVMHDLIQGWPVTFEEWAEDLGLDTDSRRAERSFNECCRITRGVEALFSDVSLDDLAALLESY